MKYNFITYMMKYNFILLHSRFCFLKFSGFELFNDWWFLGNPLDSPRNWPKNSYGRMMFIPLPTCQTSSKQATIVLHDRSSQKVT